MKPRTEDLIDHAMRGNYGLARAYWLRTLRGIRALPVRKELRMAPKTDKTNMRAPKPISTIAAIDQRITAFVGLRRACVGKGSAESLAQAIEYTKMINDLLDDRWKQTAPSDARIAA